MSKRTAVALAALAGLVAGGVIGFAWHAPGRAGTWADFRTWLGFSVVLIGVPIALRQLSLQRHQLASQQEVIEGEVERNKRRDALLDGQLAELQQRQEVIERAQADEVDFTWTDTARDDTGKVSIATVVNGSRRPIRDVTCMLHPGAGQAPIRAAHVGPMAHWQIPAPAGQWLLLEESTAPGHSARLIRAGWRFGFVFDGRVGDHAGALMTARFTDDAGLHWQAGHDLHLQKLDDRDDW